jgi:hypothetical protein
MFWGLSSISKLTAGDIHCSESLELNSQAVMINSCSVQWHLSLYGIKGKEDRQQPTYSACGAKTPLASCWLLYVLCCSQHSAWHRCAPNALVTDWVGNLEGRRPFKRAFSFAVFWFSGWSLGSSYYPATEGITQGEWHLPGMRTPFFFSKITSNRKDKLLYRH